MSESAPQGPQGNPVDYLQLAQQSAAAAHEATKVEAWMGEYGKDEAAATSAAEYLTGRNYIDETGQERQGGTNALVMGDEKTANDGMSHIGGGAEAKNDNNKSPLELMREMAQVEMNPFTVKDAQGKESSVIDRSRLEELRSQAVDRLTKSGRVSAEEAAKMVESRKNDLIERAKKQNPSADDILKASIDQLNGKDTKVKATKLEKLSADETADDIEKRLKALQEQALKNGAKDPKKSADSNSGDDKDSKGKTMSKEDLAKYEADEEEAYALHEKFEEVKKWLADESSTLEPRLNGAQNDYVERTSRQRSGHIGRLQKGSKFRSLMSKIPFMKRLGTSRHAKMDAQTEASRVVFRDQLQKYTNLYRTYESAYVGEHAAAQRQVVRKLNALDEIEGDIIDKRQENTNTSHQTMDKFGNWVARSWEKSGRKSKVFKLAVVAGAAGAIIGTGGVLLAPGAILGVGVGGVTTFAAGLTGRKIGHGVARSASNRAILTESGEQRATQRAVGRYSELKDNIETKDAREIAQELDITQQVEAGTTRDVQENLRRRKLAGTVAGTVGALAAGGAIGVHHIFGTPHQAANNAASNAGSSSNSGSSALQQSGANTITQAPAANTASTAPNLHQLPFNVAEQLPGGTPNNAMAAVQHAINVANQVPGTANHYSLMAANGYQQVALNGHLMNSAQEAAFNAFIS